MKLGFILFDYFPFGGLQRDCLQIATLCARQGHEVLFFTRSWQGATPDGMKVEQFGRHGLTIPARNRRFVHQLAESLPRHKLDGVIGFNKLPGLDLYYGADPCYAAALETKPAWTRWLPRARQYLQYEASVFGATQRCVILQINPRDIPLYRKYYGTGDRFHLLPPNARRHETTAADVPAARRRIREQNGWSPDDFILLFVGSDFQRKGLDRSIRALAALEPAARARTRLVVVGSASPGRFARLSRQLGVADRVHFLGGRHDVPDWMLGADILTHPARSENTGSVLVEALSFGLPVFVTDICGYAPHVTVSGAGCTFAEPFEASLFERAIAEAVSSEVLDVWRQRAWDYAATGAIFGCHEHAAEIILNTIGDHRAALRPVSPPNSGDAAPVHSMPSA
ncbi:MAG: UDP-glucose:(heptosyl)LPS alpha,3-glucosyltransferase [Verrucomicrobiota bacterium]|jgi:UDP-glucose:(heptosyl)LPS alpha-1,3-glucosyltransferase